MRQTKRWLLPLVMALVGLTSGAFAQSSAYSFSTSSGTLDTLVGGVHVPNLEGDTRTSSPIDIGFDFEFNGVMYDTIIAMSDGFISFNTSATSAATNDLDNTAASRYPLIAPLWDDLDGRATPAPDTSAASYQTSGTAPNRIFTFEWKRWEWRYLSSNPVVTFQVKLYETSNVIEFYYRSEGNNPSSPSASIGIADGASFLSLTSIATPTVSSTSETTSLDSVPDGTIYTFTPPSCIAPSNLALVSVGIDSAKINWDFVGAGTQFAYINVTSGTTPSGQGMAITADSVTVSGLMGNTDYDFYVREICAVGDSSNWVGPFSYTTACSPFTVPYFEGFESMTSVGAGVIPDCWAETGDWGTADAPTTYNRQPRTGSNYLFTNWSATDVIYTAPITLTAGTSYDFSYYYSTDGNNGWDSINAYVGNAQDINTMSSIGSTIYDPVNTSYIEDINTFIPSSTGTYYFAIRVKATSSPWYISFDDISVNVTPTCPAPSNITLEAIGIDSAKLAWNFVNTGTQFAYINVTSGTTPSGQGTVITADSVTVSGLMANTDYDFYVREICAVGDSSFWTGPFTYTTDCDLITVFPWTEDFESAVVPNAADCFKVINNNGDVDEWESQSSSTYANSGSQSMEIYTDINSGNNDDYLILPGFVLTGNEWLRYFYRARSAGEPNDFQILVSQTGVAPSDFIDTIHVDTINNTSYLEEFIDLSTYTGATYIAFHVPNGGLDGWRIYLDDMTVEAIPNCFEPTNLAITNYTFDSVTIEWAGDANNPGTQFNYFVGQAGSTPGGAGTMVPDDSVTLSGLTPYVQYDFYVREACGANDTSNWVGPVTFAFFPDAAALPCGSNFASVIFTEEFDNNNAGWTGDIGNSDGDWEIPDASGSSSTGADNAYSGNSYMNYEASATSVDSGSIVSPMIDLSTAQTAAQLSFWMHAYGSDMGTLTVGVGTSATGPFTTEFTWSGQLQTSGSDPWVNVVVDLTAYIGQQVYVEFKQVDNSSFEGDMSIDLFEVSTCVTCPAPINLNAFNSTGNTIDLAWNSPANGTDFEYELVPQGSSFTGSGTMVANDTVTATVTPNTLYDFYVREVCGAMDTSLWAGPFTFTSIRTATGVSCGANFSQVIFTEEFDNNNAGWTGDVGTGNGNWEIPEGSSGNTGADNAFSGSEFMNFEASGTSLDTGSIVSPMIDLTSGVSQAELSFWMHAYGVDMGELHVGVGTSATGPFTNVFSWIGELQTDGADPWQNVGIDLSAYVGQQIYIELQQIDSTGALGDMSIDLFEVTTCVSCPDPINVVVSNITSNSAEVDWTSVAAGASYAYINVTTGTAPTGQGTIISTDSVALTSLMDDTSYDFYVREVCGAADSSNWVGPITYTTPCNVFVAPYYENFDGSEWTNGSGSSNAGDAISSCWFRNPATSSDYFWGTRSGSTASTSTGPTGDNTTGSDNYMYTEASNGSGGDTAFLMTPSIDLSGLTNPHLSFAYHMYGGDIQTLYIYANQGGTITVIDSIVGQQQTGGSDPWETMIIDVSAFTSAVTRFGWYTEKDDFNGDVSIDDVSIDNLFNDDLGVTAFIPPASFCGDSNTIIQVVVQNFGIQDQDGFDVTVDWTGSTTGSVTVTYNDTLAYGEFDTINVDTLNTVLGGTFNLAGYTTLTGDGNINNDTTLAPGVTFFALPVVDLGTAQTFCDNVGFSATLDAGNAGSTFLWNDGSTNQTLAVTTGDTYWVEVTDVNGCISSDTVVYTELTSAVVDLGVDLTYCEGTTFIDTLDAGNAGSTFLWSDGSTNQELPIDSAGTYWVEVTNVNNCVSTDTLEVTEEAAPMVSVANDTVCDGETATLDAGAGFASYNWSTTATTQTIDVMTAGTYTVTVTNAAGCTAEDSAEVIINALPVITALIGDTVCEGTNVTLNAGTVFIAYNWSTGETTQTIDVSMAGTYTVTVTNAEGCEASDSATVGFNANPVVDLGADTGLAPTQSIVLDAGNDGSTYSWSTGAADQTVTITYADVPTTVSVEVTNAEGCTGVDTIFIDRFVGISEVVQGNINLYPNPVANDVHIAFTAKQAGAVNIKVFDVSGQLVDIINQDINTGLVDVSWSMSTLESGVYFIQATLNNKDLGQFRVVKQ